MTASERDHLRAESERDSRKRYLTEEYEDAVAALADPESERDVSTEAAVDAFRQECETFEELFTDDTPLSAVRRVAFRRTRQRLSGE